MVHRLTGAQGHTTGGQSLVPTGAQGPTGATLPVTGWSQRHCDAINRPRGIECAIVSLRDGLRRYGLEYPENFERCQVGSDRELGPAWLRMARGYLDLLNGPTGRLDCGTLDSEVRAWALEYGFEEEV